jgi:protein-arginine kinase activator protein McsA
VLRNGGAALEVLQKPCTACGEVLGLAVAHFSRHPRTRDGFQSVCRRCAAARVRARRREIRDGVAFRTASCVECSRVFSYRTGRSGRPPITCSARCTRERVNLKTRIKTYGLTMAEWEAMVAAANGCCVACSRKTARLVVDHCHETGAVRGLVCHSCNTGLGALGDDAVGLWATQVYLARATLDLRDLCAA